MRSTGSQTLLQLHYRFRHQEEHQWKRLDGLQNANNTSSMVGVTVKHLQDAAKKYKEAAEELRAWTEVVKAARWRLLAERFLLRPSVFLGPD